MVIKNPKRSGGPKSSEGKLVASQNSLKTGSYSSLAVLPNESPEEFNQLVTQFHRDFHPADVIETSLVRELAVITWKKLRLEKLEQDHFIKNLNAPIKMDELIDCGLRFDEDRYRFWSGQVSLDDAEFSNFTETLSLIKPNQRIGISANLLQEINALHPIIYTSLLDAFRQLEPLAEPEISDEELVERTVRYPNQPERFLTSVIFERFVTLIESALWVTKKKAEIDQAVVQIKQERLLMIMQSDDVRRAGDDLSRSLMRTLEQFRKHNQWRMQHRVFDTEEE